MGRLLVVIALLLAAGADARDIPSQTVNSASPSIPQATPATTAGPDHGLGLGLLRRDDEAERNTCGFVSGNGSAYRSSLAAAMD
jgi:hypothetical protein